MKAGTTLTNSRIKRTQFLLTRSFITLCLTIFIATTYLLTPTLGLGVEAKKDDLKDLIQNLLTNPSAFAQQLGDVASFEELTPTGYLNPLLPDNVLPDFGINFSCNSSQSQGTRTVEFYYDNKTEYRVNLDRSTVRVGSVDVDPYSVRDATKVEELKKAGISIVQTHFNSDLMVREVIVTDADGNQTTTLEYTSKPDVLALPEAEQIGWVTAGNNGPLDYLNPGRNIAMVLEVPYDSTVVWTAGVQYSDTQKTLTGGKDKYQKTTTASTGNLKNCKEKKQSPSALTIDNAPRTPFDIEIGRLNARTTSDDRTTDCRAESFLKGINTKQVIGKGNTPISLDYGTITTVGLGNRNLVTGTSDSIKNLPRNLKAGTYSIAIHTSENHNGVDKPQDVNESVFVQLFDKNKQPLVSSNATYDLGDKDNNLVQVVNVDLEIPAQAQYYQVLHNAQEVTSLNELGEEVKTFANQTPSPFVIATNPETGQLYSEFTSSNSIQAVCASFGYHRPVVTVSSAVLECLSSESNKQLAVFKQDPRKLAQPNVFKATLQTILQTCIPAEILAQYSDVFTGINESQIKVWYNKYAQDGIVTPEEVREGALELADRGEIRLSISGVLGGKGAGEVVSSSPEIEPGTQADVTTQNSSGQKSQDIKIPLAQQQNQKTTTVISYLTSFFSGITTSAQTQTSEVGGLDLMSYCKKQNGSGSQAKVTGQGAYGWTCNGVRIDYDDACLKQYGSRSQSSIGKTNDPYSIACIVIPFTPRGLDLAGYCRNRFGVGAALKGNTANDWVCETTNIPINYNAVCVNQYGSGAYASTSNAADPYSWACLAETDNGGGSESPADEEHYLDYPDNSELSDQLFELSAEPNDDAVWSTLKQIPEKLVSDIDGFIYGDFSLDCGSLGFACEKLLGSAQANMIQMLVSFIWGIFEGMATFFSDFVDLIKMIWNIRDSISGLWGMVVTILTDPMSLLSMVWDYFADFITKPIVEKIKFVGFIIGNELKDFLVGIFTGGAGLASKITGVLTDVVDKVKSVSKLANKGLNALENLVGSAVEFGNGITGTVRKVGARVGLIGSDILTSIKNASPQQARDFINRITNSETAEKLARYKYIETLCGGLLPAGAFRLQSAGGCTRITGATLDALRLEHRSLKKKWWRKIGENNKPNFNWTERDLSEMKKGNAPYGPDNKKMEFHHIQPLSFGGDNSLANQNIMTYTEHRAAGMSRANHTPPFNKYTSNAQEYGL